MSEVHCIFRLGCPMSEGHCQVNCAYADFRVTNEGKSPTDGVAQSVPDTGRLPHHCHDCGPIREQACGKYGPKKGRDICTLLNIAAIIEDSDYGSCADSLREVAKRMGDRS